MEFLEGELKRDFDNKFVFLHVPPFDPRRYLLDIQEIVRKDIKPEHALSDKDNAQQFMDLMSKYNVTTVFASHIHGYFHESYGDTSYIITGGAGGEMWPSNPEHYFYHYVNVCVNENNIDYEVIKFPSPDSNRIDRFSYAIWLYVWYFIITHRNELIALILILALVIDLFYSPLIKLIRILRKRLSITKIKKFFYLISKALNSVKLFFIKVYHYIFNKINKLGRRKH